MSSSKGHDLNFNVTVVVSLITSLVIGERAKQVRHNRALQI